MKSQQAQKEQGVMAKRGEKQPKMIPNPLYCEKCEGRGYLVGDAEWEPIAVKCDGPAHAPPSPSETK